VVPQCHGFPGAAGISPPAFEARDTALRTLEREVCNPYGQVKA
jgi:hypothetical protein